MPENEADAVQNITTLNQTRGKIHIFVDGNNIFHAGRSIGLEIDYAKLLKILVGSDRLLRATFYTGSDMEASNQQGFLMWMRRNGWHVVEKFVKTFGDGSKKANLDVEICCDMLIMAPHYDTAILVSGDEDFTYVVGKVQERGPRVELAGFKNNTAPKLIDSVDRFIDLDSQREQIRKINTKVWSRPSI